MTNTTNDPKMIYRAKTVAAKQMNRYIGQEIEIADIIQFETSRSETGEDAVSTVIFAANGDMYSTLSPTIAKCVDALYESFDDDIRGLLVRITDSVSNSGNRFLQLDLA